MVKTVRHIELDAPNISGLEADRIQRCLDSGFVSTFGPFVPEFEEKFADYVGSGYAVSTQSGTAAIHAALHELGVGKGDEVIVPALTFIATVNPVAYLGAEPVFADVDIGTWNISSEEIEKSITKKTKAIIPVHLFGNPCNMEDIMDIAGRHGLYVVEDATESLGAIYKGRYTGTIGDLGCFSFNGNKVITTGGGGMVTGDDEKRLSHIKFLVNQARDVSKGYYHPEIGFNYRMTSIEAALGLAQLERLDSFLSKKKRFDEIYRAQLKETGFIRFQAGCEGAVTSPWLTSVIFENNTDIAVLQKRLRDKGIPSRRIFTPLMTLPPYEGYRRSNCGNSRFIYEKGLSLPGSTLNSEDDIYHVCETIKETIRFL